MTVPFKEIFIWTWRVFIGARGHSLFAVSRGSLLSSCVYGLLLALTSSAEECGCWGAQDSGFAVPRLSSCGTQACLLLGVWDLPGPGIEPVVACTGGQILDHRATREAGRSACYPLPLPQRCGGEGHLWNPGCREERGPVGACWTFLVIGISCSIRPSPELVALAGAVHVFPGCHTMAVVPLWWPTPGTPVPSALGACLVPALESRDPGLVLVGWKTPVDPR